MDVSTFERLLSPSGRQVLVAAQELTPTEAKYPACFDRLRKHFSPELARAALDTVLLRVKARAKFSRAEEMFFTREALEMASAEPVARYRASRFAGCNAVADLCCGIGGDAIGLALAGYAVTAVDRDPLRVLMARTNLEAYGGTGRFLCADVLTVDLPDCAAAFADPGRRPGGRRILSLQESEPPLSALVSRFPRGFPLGVKVAPGFPKEDLNGFAASLEFISYAGELKECFLGFGPLHTSNERATILPGPHTLVGDANTSAELGPVGRYLYDPDPAVTRAGLVGVLAQLLGAWQFDSRIAFLSSDSLVPTPFASVYAIEEVIPFHARKIGEWLKVRNVGRVTVVKRGSAVDADELASRWKLRGDEHRAVILTQVVGKPVAILGERVETKPAERDRSAGREG